MVDWRPVVGYEERYLISSDGRVRSLISGIIMHQCLSTSGYPVVNLSNGTGQKVHRIHRLVAAAFLPKPIGRCVVNHKNGNKLDNSVRNLEWCTSRENNYHSCYILKNKSGNAMRPVLSIDIRTGTERTFPSVNEAARQLGCIGSHILMVLNGVMTKHRGYAFKDMPVAAHAGDEIKLKKAPF